jgi:hypothetical protein
VIGRRMSFFFRVIRSRLVATTGTPSIQSAPDIPCPLRVKLRMQLLIICIDEVIIAI